MLGIHPEQALPSPVECPGPRESICQNSSIGAQDVAADTLDATGHLRSGSFGKRHEENTARVAAFDNKMGDAQGVRLA